MSQVVITRDPIAAEALVRAVAHQANGATSLFLGTVREMNDGRAVTGIDYHAYEAMAEAEMGRIADEVARAYPGIRIAVSHRIGFLALGEISVAIAVSHAHRAPAMDATRFVIEALKRRVPIWKREHYADGSREWVDPTAGGGSPVDARDAGVEPGEGAVRDPAEHPAAGEVMR